MSKSSSKADAIGGSGMLPTGSPFPGFEEDNELHDKMQGRKVVLMEGWSVTSLKEWKKLEKKHDLEEENKELKTLCADLKTKLKENNDIVKKTGN